MSDTQKNRKKKTAGGDYIVQGSILAVASIISRIIGLIYRIPMQRILGDIGIGYYSTAFEIYNVMLIISSYSLPLAVSKMVSAQMAKKRRTATYQILKCALLFATISGTTVALILFFGGNFFATTLLNTPYSIFAARRPGEERRRRFFFCIWEVILNMFGYLFTCMSVSIV